MGNIYLIPSQSSIPVSLLYVPVKGLRVSGDRKSPAYKITHSILIITSL